MQILLIEDDPNLSSALSDLLEDEGYEVQTAGDGSTALALAEESTFDLVILDLEIPPPSGLDLLEIWRSRGRHTPVLILTAQADVERRVAGLDAGADDYMTKPFDFAELLSRAAGLVERKAGTTIIDLRAGDLDMNRPDRRVLVASEEIPLTLQEFALLEYLLARKGELVTRTDIVDHVWDASFDLESNIISVLIYRLRRKIDGGAELKLLHTVKGLGYVLSPERCREPALSAERPAVAAGEDRNP